MIAFKDFVPTASTTGGFFAQAQYEMLEQTVRRANDWIKASQKKIVNVETVVLPNIHLPYEDGSTDPELRSSGDMGTHWHQFVRVWYEDE